jgi:hypothetical protein
MIKIKKVKCNKESERIILLLIYRYQLQVLIYLLLLYINVKWRKIIFHIENQNKHPIVCGVV